MKPIGRRNTTIFLTALILVSSMSALIWGFPRAALSSRGLATGSLGKTASRHSHSSSKQLGSTPASKTVQDAISANHVMVFSKTYCPYCSRAKDALYGLKANGMEVYELDVRKDGDELQAALLALTGQRTVPNIFIGGKHVGGCDTTLAKIADGSLQKMLK